MLTTNVMASLRVMFQKKISEFTWVSALHGEKRSGSLAKVRNEVKVFPVAQKAEMTNAEMAAAHQARAPSGRFLGLFVRHTILLGNYSEMFR